MCYISQMTAVASQTLSTQVFRHFETCVQEYQSCINGSGYLPLLVLPLDGNAYIYQTAIVPGEFGCYFNQLTTLEMLKLSCLTVIGPK